MMAEYLDKQVSLAEQDSRNGKTYPGKRWKDEGGLCAYKTYAKHWLSEVASFMKLSDMGTDNFFEDGMMSYLQKIKEPSPDTIRYQDQCVLFRQDIMNNIAPAIWLKIRNYIKGEKECKFDRNLKISDKGREKYKRFFQIPLFLLPEKVKESLVSMNVVPALP